MPIVALLGGDGFHENKIIEHWGDRWPPIQTDELRAIAKAIRELEARAKRAGEPTLAYLLDMAALEAHARAREDR